MRPSHLLAVVLLAVAVLVPGSGQAAESPSIRPSSAHPHSYDENKEAPVATVSTTPTPDVALRWAADDAPIINGDSSHTWTWGPQIFRSTAEAYAEAPNSLRAVWYLDKARMELTYPHGDSDEPWFVTSGLLVREMMSGRIQTGDATYETRTPPDTPLAGDLDAPAEATITLLDLQPLASLNNDRRAPARTDYDASVVEVLGKGGVVTQAERLLQYDVHLRSYDPVLGHNIAHVFTDALPTDKLLYTAGRPLSEPYWTVVPIKHVPTDVLVQAFERRILTYTPSNPAGWQVEWGNVGRQYAQWRYGQAETGQPLNPVLLLEAKPGIRKLETLSPEAAGIAEERQVIVGVAVLNMRTGDIYSVRGSRSFPMYSTAKVPIMVGVLSKAQREKRAVADWEDSLIRAMIQHSDNDSATTLITHAGGAQAVTQYLHAIGLDATTMDNDAWGYSTTTAQDMARLMAKLGNCTILNPELCLYALEVMRGVTPGQRWGLSAGPPESVSVAFKNGWSPDDGGWTINSIGYVKGKQMRYAVAVYSGPNPTMPNGIETIEAISTEIYAAMR